MKFKAEQYSESKKEVIHALALIAKLEDYEKAENLIRMLTEVAYNQGRLDYQEELIREVN